MGEYEAIQGQGIQLNCNLSTLPAEDAIQLVFWYKGESNKPIYSVDARNPSRPRHFNYFAVQALKATSSTGSARTSTSPSASLLSPSFAPSSSSSSSVLHEEFAESAQLRRLAERLSLAPNFSLRIDRLSREDGGLYRCRVDFRYARTLNSLMRLHVIGKWCSPDYVFII